MADNQATRNSKRPPRSTRSLGAIRKGAEVNLATATARSGTREPLLSKQAPTNDSNWGEDDWSDSNWGDNGKPGTSYHQSQPSNGGSYHNPYAPSSRTRSGGSRLGSLGNRGRTCLTAMVVIMMVIGASFIISGSRYGGRSTSEQKTITSSTMQRENTINTNNNNKKSSSTTSIDVDDEFQVAPEVERKSSSGGEWGDYEDTSTPNSSGDLELDYADENDARSNSLPTTSSTTKTNSDDENGLGGATSDGASTSTGVWGTAQKPTLEEDDYYPGSGTGEAASMKASPSTTTTATAAKQKSTAEQYPETDYDADYDTPATTTTTTTNQDSIKQQDEFRAAAGEGDEADNSDVVDSRGWSGEDVGAAADEGFEGDGSFSDGGDVAEKRGEEELEDEEDYGSLLDSRDGRGDGDDGLEEGEESHYLGRKPDERPLTGGQDWEGDNVAALVNEGEGEEREGIHDDVVVDGNRGGGGGNSDYYDEEQYREEEEDEGAEYDYDGNPVDASSSRPSSAGTGQQTTGSGTENTQPQQATGTSSQKKPPLSKPSSSLDDAEDLNNLDLEDVDPFTAEKLIEQQEIQQRVADDEAGAFSSALIENNTSNEFLDAFDSEYSEGIDDSSGGGVTTTPGSRPAAAGAKTSATTSAAAAAGGARTQPSQVTSSSNNKGTSSTSTSSKQGTSGGTGADLRNDDYAEKKEEEQEDDIDYSAGEDAALPKGTAKSGDVSLRPTNTATSATKPGVSGDGGGGATASRPGATTSTVSSGVQKQQVKPVNTTATVKKVGSPTSTSSSIAKPQGSANTTATAAAASAGSAKTVTSGAVVKKTNTTTTTASSTVAGEARNRRSGTAGGVLPGRGGEEPPESLQNTQQQPPLKVGANKPGGGAAGGATTTASDSKDSQGQLSQSLPIPTPKNAEEAMIRVQKIDDAEEQDYSNAAAGNDDDDDAAAEEEEDNSGPGEKSSSKVPQAASSSKASPSGTKSSTSEKTSTTTTTTTPIKKEATTAPSKSSKASSSPAGTKKSSKGMRRSLRSEIRMVRLKKHPQPYGEENSTHHEQRAGEGNQRRRKSAP